jgi:hypothetical protein
VNDILNTQLIYNGCALPFVRTEEFRQEPFYSADGVDLLGLHFTITVSGYLHSCFLGMDPAQWIEQSRFNLLQRGGQLYMYMGGIEVFPSTPNSSPAPTTGNELVASPLYDNPDNYTAGRRPVNYANAVAQDVRLGPRPIRFDVRKISGGSYTFVYSIETWVAYCADNSLPAAILSNRWESSLDIDSDYYYTRTTTGTLVVNGQYLSDSNFAASVLGQFAAELVFPPLFKNWKRETIRFTLSSDQLTLNYTIQDKQLYVAIPRPCSKIEASYAEICPPPQQGGGIALMNFQQVNMDVTVYGDPSTMVDDSYPTGLPTNPDKLKWMLMQIMFNVVFQRFLPDELLRIGDGSEHFGINTMITHFELREDVMKPIVGCRIVGWKARPQIANLAGSPASWQASVFAATQVGQPLILTDMIDQIASTPISQANWATFLLLQSVYPQGPCEGGEIPETAGYFYPFSTTVYSTQISTAQTSIGTAYQTNVDLSTSYANYQFPFTDYTATVDYITDNHIIQSPVMYDVDGAGPGTTQASSIFTQTASQTSQKIIHWKASRMGAWPKVPRPDSVDVYGGSLPSDRVLNSTYQFGEVELSHDTLTRHYAASGILTIGMARRLQWDVGSTVLSTICSPVIGSSFYGGPDASFPTNNFVAGILCSGQSPGAS